MVRYNINKVRQTTPLKCLYIDHQHICIYSCHRYNRWVPGLPVDVVREFEGSTWSSGDWTDRWTTASHLHSPAVVRNTTSWEYSWLAGHQQVPEDPAAVGAGTCCIFQGFPPQYYRVMYGAVISDFSRGKFLFFIFNSFCIHFTQTRMRRESFLPDLLVEPFIVSIKEVTPHFMTKKPWCCWCWLILFFFFLPSFFFSNRAPTSNVNFTSYSISYYCTTGVTSFVHLFWLICQWPRRLWRTRPSLTPLCRFATDLILTVTCELQIKLEITLDAAVLSYQKTRISTKSNCLASVENILK